MDLLTHTLLKSYQSIPYSLQVNFKDGDMTGDAVHDISYLMVHLVSVILTEINRVAVVIGMESVVTQQHIVLVVPVQTTHVYTESGKNQEVHRSGGMTGSVVV